MDDRIAEYLTAKWLSPEERGLYEKVRAGHEASRHEPQEVTRLGELSYRQALWLTKGRLLVPVLGAGAGLLAAEERGRACIAAEADPRLCGDAIGRWMELTGLKAEPCLLGRF